MNWVSELDSRVHKFVCEMQSDNYSYFKYSYSGDLYSNDSHWGLANIVYAVKILYTTGILDKLDIEKKKNLTNSILSFSNDNGYINDSFLTKRTFREKFQNLKKAIISRKISYLKDASGETKRAETRQSFAALYLLGAKPSMKFVDIPNSEKAIDFFLSSLDWTKPWGAGSHFSHLMFFLEMNCDLDSRLTSKNQRLIHYSNKWINRLQSSNDGAWYTGDVDLSQKINGAMKIITGLHAAGIYDVANAKPLINLALSAANDEHACSNFNVVYVLYGATIVEPNYRKDEIGDFLRKRLKIYRNFYWPEIGGFSFHDKSANTVLYGKKISKGLAEPDIHGTIMFIWGISLINRMLNLGLNWRIPLN